MQILPDAPMQKTKCVQRITVDQMTYSLAAMKRIPPALPTPPRPQEMAMEDEEEDVAQNAEEDAKDLLTELKNLTAIGQINKIVTRS